VPRRLGCGGLAPWRVEPSSGRTSDTYGELGIRHEDTVVVTENGCENLAPN